VPRVISLIPSSTEIVCALGGEKSLVGISHECDYPATIKNLPVTTKPSFDVNGTSLEIDQRVKSNLHNGYSLYQVDSKLVEELKPDVIITQAHCHVCAVSEEEVKNTFAKKIAEGLRIVSHHPGHY